MKNFFTIILLFVTPFSCAILFGQQRPKVGIVLSGGGAKGLAHIGALMALEEMKIKIDYIAGTSMGAVVGGLYACGYNASQLDSIVKHNDLNELILGDLPREYTDIRQRVYNEKTILNLTYKDRKLNIPSGISSGQQVYNFLWRTTFPENKEQQFDNLPIPFFCVATNLLNGEEVILKNGSLPFAIRASMSFPTLLYPIPYQDKLLIDGGVTNNLPAKELKEMGADIIIGVSTESGLYNREELGSMTNIISQLGSYNLVKKSIEQYKFCDILIEPKVENISIIDLAQSHSIIQRGYEATYEVIEDINKLKISSETYKLPYKSDKQDLIKIDSIELYVASDKEKAFVLSQLSFIFDRLVSIEDINEGITLLQSLNQYENIEYSIDKNDGLTHLCIYPAPKKNYQNTIGAAIHFDNFYRNSLLIQNSSSGIIQKEDLLQLDLVLGNKFRYNLNYNLNKRESISPGLKSSFNQNSINVKLNNPIAVDSTLTLEELSIEYIDFTNEFHLLFNKKNNSFFEISAGIKRFKIGINELSDEMNGNFRFDDSWNMFTELRYYFDNLNSRQFSMRGKRIVAKANLLKPFINNLTSSEDYQSSLNIDINIVRLYSLNNNFSIGINLKGGITPIGNHAVFTYHLGSASKNLPNNLKSFPGLDFGRASSNAALIVGTMFRWKASKNIYLTFEGNGAWLDEPIPNIITSTTTTYAGLNISIGYSTILGPIEIIYGHTKYDDNLYFNLGYWF